MRRLIFSALSFLVAVPSAIKVFNWLATLYKRLDHLRGARCCTAWRFVVLFTAGGITGLFLATLGVDMHVHATYFVVGPLPFHHGRRNGDGLHGRAALLVAENHRAHVLRVVVATWPR